MKEPNGIYNCKGCKHWKPITHDKLFYCCHYLLDVGKCCPRDYDKGVCFGREIGEKFIENQFNKDNKSSLPSRKWKGET